MPGYAESIGPAKRVCWVACMLMHVFWARLCIPGCIRPVTDSPGADLALDDRGTPRLVQGHPLGLHGLLEADVPHFPELCLHTSALSSAHLISARMLALGLSNECRSSGMATVSHAASLRKQQVSTVTQHLSRRLDRRLEGEGAP